MASKQEGCKIFLFFNCIFTILSANYFKLFFCPDILNGKNKELR